VYVPGYFEQVFVCFIDFISIPTNFQVLSAHFRAYIQALEKLQLDIATSTDLLGVETRSTGFLFSVGKEPLKSRSSVFALGERINILKVSCLLTLNLDYLIHQQVWTFML
jgi:hypothetical protein